MTPKGACLIGSQQPWCCISLKQVSDWMKSNNFKSETFSLYHFSSITVTQTVQNDMTSIVDCGWVRHFAHQAFFLLLIHLFVIHVFIQGNMIKPKNVDTVGILQSMNCSTIFLSLQDVMHLREMSMSMRNVLKQKTDTYKKGIFLSKKCFCWRAALVEAKIFHLIICNCFWGQPYYFTLVAHKTRRSCCVYPWSLFLSLVSGKSNWSEPHQSPENRDPCSEENQSYVVWSRPKFRWAFTPDKTKRTIRGNQP